MLDKIDDMLKVYGIPKSHIAALQAVASKNDTVIGIRTVKPTAHYFLDNGYPTKPFTVKTKTSDRGVAASLIPIDPQYSRMAYSDPSSPDTEKYKKGLKKILEDGAFQAVPLWVSKKHLEDLIGLSHGDLVVTPSAESGAKITWGDRVVYAAAGQSVYDEASPDGDEGYFIFEDESQERPLMVLGSEVNGRFKPITTDYDLLVVAPNYARFDPGHEDRLPISVQSQQKSDLKREELAVLEKKKQSLWKTFMGELTVEDSTTTIEIVDKLAALESKRVEIERYYSSNPDRVSLMQRRAMFSAQSDYDGSKEDTMMGNVSPRVRGTIGDINQAIALVDPHRSYDNPTVHHNAELANPFASDLDFPVIFIFPKERTFVLESGKEVTSTLLLLTSMEELTLIRGQLPDYYWQTNAKFSEHLPSFRVDALGTAELVTARAVEALTARTAGTSSLDDLESVVGYVEDDEEEEYEEEQTEEEAVSSADIVRSPASRVVPSLKLPTPSLSQASHIHQEIAALRQKQAANETPTDTAEDDMPENNPKKSPI